MWAATCRWPGVPPPWDQLDILQRRQIFERDRRTPRRDPTCRVPATPKVMVHKSQQFGGMPHLPADVVDNSHRSKAGHGEGDLIICKCTRPVLVLHERKSQVTLAARLTGKPPQKPSQPCSRCSAASIRTCEDQSLSATTPPSPRPAQDHARHDHLVLRRLCLMTKKRRRKRQ
jgi:hypothetical protein